MICAKRKCTQLNLPAPQGQFLIYADGASQLRVRLDGNTVWLTQKLIAELYCESVKTVNEDIVNIYGDAELPEEATLRKFRIVQLSVQVSQLSASAIGRNTGTHSELSVTKALSRS